MTSGAEVFELLLWGLVWTLLISAVLYMLRRRKPAEPPAIPPPMLMAPMLTTAESNALALAMMTGAPVQFAQIHPQTGHWAQFIATPTGGGHGHITPATGYAYPGPYKSV
jgi:hypothetical protein